MFGGADENMIFLNWPRRCLNETTVVGRLKRLTTWKQHMLAEQRRIARPRPCTTVMPYSMRKNQAIAPLRTASTFWLRVPFHCWRTFVPWSCVSSFIHPLGDRSLGAGSGCAVASEPRSPVPLAAARLGSCDVGTERRKPEHRVGHRGRHLRKCTRRRMYLYAWAVRIERQERERVGR
jgi:hypothetical protein